MLMKNSSSKNVILSSFTHPHVTFVLIERTKDDFFILGEVSTAQALKAKVYFTLYVYARDSVQCT